MNYRLTTLVNWSPEHLHYRKKGVTSNYRSGNQTVAGSRINDRRCQIRRHTVTVSYKYIIYFIIYIYIIHTHIIVKISRSYYASSGFRFSFLFQPSVSAFSFSLPFQLSVSAFRFSLPFHPFPLSHGRMQCLRCHSSTSTHWQNILTDHQQ